MAGICEEVSFDFEKALKQSRMLIVGNIKHDSEVLKNLIYIGFKDIEVISETGFFKSDAENYEKNVKANLKVANIQFHTHSALDYGVNFFKRFNVVFSIAESLEVTNYLIQICSAADVPLIEKEMLQQSEKVVKEKFKTRFGHMVMELMAVYQVMQGFEKKPRTEVNFLKERRKSKEGDHDSMKELTEALQMNMQIIRSHSMALDKYTDLLAELPSQIQSSVSSETNIAPILRQMVSLLRELSNINSRTNDILSGTSCYMSPSI